MTIAPGQVVDLGTLTLVFRPRPDIPQNGGLDVQVVEQRGQPDHSARRGAGATVRLRNAATTASSPTQAGAADQTSFFFQPLPIGTYRVEVTRGVDLPPVEPRWTSVGLGNTTSRIPIYLLGQVSGRLVDSVTGDELVDYDVQIRRVNPDGSQSEPCRTCR